MNLSPETARRVHRVLAALRDEPRAVPQDVRADAMRVLREWFDTGPPPPQAEAVAIMDDPGDQVPDLTGLRIVVCDDYADALSFIETALRMAGAMVDCFLSAKAALESIRRFAPHVLISDIAMPEESGLWLIREVRKTHPRLPAIALSAHARVRDQAAALSAGYDLHLPKPVYPEQLAEAVLRARAAVRGTEV